MPNFEADDTGGGYAANVSKNIFSTPAYSGSGNALTQASVPVATVSPTSVASPGWGGATAAQVSQPGWGSSSGQPATMAAAAPSSGAGGPGWGNGGSAGLAGQAIAGTLSGSGGPSSLVTGGGDTDVLAGGAAGTPPSRPPLGLGAGYDPDDYTGFHETMNLQVSLNDWAREHGWKVMLKEDGKYGEKTRKRYAEYMRENGIPGSANYVSDEAITRLSGVPRAATRAPVLVPVPPAAAVPLPRLRPADGKPLPGGVVPEVDIPPNDPDATADLTKTMTPAELERLYTEHPELRPYTPPAAVRPGFTLDTPGELRAFTLAHNAPPAAAARVVVAQPDAESFRLRHPTTGVAGGGDVAVAAEAERARRASALVDRSVPVVPGALTQAEIDARNIPKGSPDPAEGFPDTVIPLPPSRPARAPGSLIGEDPTRVGISNKLVAATVPYGEGVAPVAEGPNKGLPPRTERMVPSVPPRDPVETVKSVVQPMSAAELRALNDFKAHLPGETITSVEGMVKKMGITDPVERMETEDRIYEKMRQDAVTAAGTKAPAAAREEKEEAKTRSPEKKVNLPPEGGLGSEATPEPGPLPPEEPEPVPGKPVAGEQTVPGTRAKTPAYSFQLSADDRRRIAQTVDAEARGESQEGRAAVAQTIFNRMAAGGFGKSFKQILSGNQYARGGKVSREALQAVDDAYNGRSPDIKGAKFFMNPGRSSPGGASWIRGGGREMVGKIGQHEFWETPQKGAEPAGTKASKAGGRGLTVEDLNAEPGGHDLDERDRVLTERYANTPWEDLPADTQKALSRAGGKTAYDAMREGLQSKGDERAESVPGEPIAAEGEEARSILEQGLGMEETPALETEPPGTIPDWANVGDYYEHEYGGQSWDDIKTRREEEKAELTPSPKEKPDTYWIVPSTLLGRGEMTPPAGFFTKDQLQRLFEIEDNMRALDDDKSGFTPEQRAKDYIDSYKGKTEEKGVPMSERSSGGGQQVAQAEGYAPPAGAWPEAAYDAARAQGVRLKEPTGRPMGITDVPQVTRPVPPRANIPVSEIRARTQVGGVYFDGKNWRRRAA